MKNKNRSDRNQLGAQAMSLRKILFYLALFLQISHLLNQSKTTKKFSPSQGLMPENNSLSFSTILATSEKAILPLFLYAIMPEKMLFSSVTASMMFNLVSLPTIQARSLKRLWKDVTRGSFGGGTFNNANEVSRSIAENIGREARITIQETGKMFEGTIEKADKSANNFLINFSNQGKLLIENFGEEIRFTVDDALKKASQHGEILLSFAGSQASLAIQESGNEARLVIHDAGDEMRLVISHATQESMNFIEGLPDPVGTIVEKAIASAINELYKQFFGLNGYKNAVIKIDDDLRKKKSFDLIETLNYIKDKNNVSPYQRAQLYQRLLLAFDVPRADIRLRTLLYIGAFAMVDEGLIENVNLGFMTYSKDYYETILISMPDASVKTILEKEDEQQFFMQLGLPMPSSKSTEVGLLSFSLTDFVPTDYVECDGSKYLIKNKPELYERIGQTYSHSSDTKTMQDSFKVPDLRDYFLRMASSTNKIGTFQDDATHMPHHPFQVEDAGPHSHQIHVDTGHNHTMDVSGAHKHRLHGLHGVKNAHVHWPDATGYNMEDYETDPVGDHVHQINNSSKHSHDMDAAGEHKHNLFGGDAETRPKNVAVKCLIRYRSTDLQVAQLEDEIITLDNTMQTMQNQYQNLQFMSFFATTVAVATGAALLFKK